MGSVAGLSRTGNMGEANDAVFAFVNQKERRFAVDEHKHELESENEGLMLRTQGRSSRPRRNQRSTRIVRHAAEGDDDNSGKVVRAGIGVDASAVDDSGAGAGGIHLPLVRTVRRRDSGRGTKRRGKRDEVTGATGLGTAQDVYVVFLFHVDWTCG